MRQINDFIDKNNKVRFSMFLKGREKGMFEMAEAQFNRLITSFDGKAIYSQSQSSYADGKIILLATLTPKIENKIAAVKE